MYPENMDQKFVHNGFSITKGDKFIKVLTLFKIRDTYYVMSDVGTSKAANIYYQGPDYMEATDHLADALYPYTQVEEFTVTDLLKKVS